MLRPFFEGRLAKFREKSFLQRNLWYYAIEESRWLKEWHLWEILTEAKRSPKPFIDRDDPGCRIISVISPKAGFSPINP